MASCCISLSMCYQNYVPSFIADHLEKIRNELVFCIEKPYVGGSAYRFKGEGNDYLKSKSIFIAPNSWDLGRSLVIYSAFAALGYLMASFGLFWMGYGLMAGCTYFALSECRENFRGNHLQKALEIINPLDSLNRINWIHSKLSRKISIEPANMTDNVMKGVDEEGRIKIVLFKLPPPLATTYRGLIKIYYIGSDLFVRSSETKTGIRIECNNLLNGTEIDSLLKAANPPLPIRISSALK